MSIYGHEVEPLLGGGPDPRAGDDGDFVKRSAPRGILKHDPSFNGRRYLDMQDDIGANYMEKQRDIGQRAGLGEDVKAEQAALDAQWRSGKDSRLEGPQGHQWGLMLKMGFESPKNIDQEQDLFDEGEDEMAREKGLNNDDQSRQWSRMAQAQVDTPFAEGYDPSERAAKLAEFNARPDGLANDHAPMAKSGLIRHNVRFAEGGPEVGSTDAGPEAAGARGLAAQTGGSPSGRETAMFEQSRAERAQQRQAAAERREGMVGTGVPRRRNGGWINPLNWGWVKKLRNWWSGSGRVQAPAEDAAPEQADAPAIEQMAIMDQAEQFQPAAAPGRPVSRRPRNPMFAKMARRQSV